MRTPEINPKYINNKIIEAVQKEEKEKNILVNIQKKSSLFSYNCLTIIGLIIAIILAIVYPEEAYELLLNINKFFNKNSGLIIKRKKWNNYR